LNILQDTSLKWQYDAVFVERKVWKCRTESKRYTDAKLHSIFWNNTTSNMCLYRD